MGQKMGQKHISPNLILDHLGCTNGCNEPILSPFWGHFGPSEVQKTLKVGLVVMGVHLQADFTLSRAINV